MKNNNNKMYNKILIKTFSNNNKTILIKKKILKNLL